ncbi:hypothetical protein AVEN_121897-1, partial [Araneus ventricosus]
MSRGIKKRVIKKLGFKMESREGTKKRNEEKESKEESRKGIKKRGIKRRYQEDVS